MPRTRRTDLLEQAFFEARIEYDQMPDEEMKECINAFEQRWGGFEIDAFTHALYEGNEADRLVALFALGRFAHEETKELLVPFLHSPIRKERWASAMVLGDQRDERAFALLGQLLVENMEYVPPSAEEDIDSIVFHAMDQAREQFGTPIAWERLVDREIAQAWYDMEAYDAEYTWYMIHRVTITNILGAWNDSRTIPMLRQALQRCWHIEQFPPSQGGLSGGFLDTWHHLEDELAYALGQLEAWDALDGLETVGLPPLYFKLARLYLIFGSLHLKLFFLDEWNISTSIQTGIIDTNQVTSILQKRFGLDEYLARANLKVFQQWYQERKQAL